MVDARRDYRDYRDRMTLDEYRAAEAKAVKALAATYSITLSDLHPVDQYDTCAHCGRNRAMVEDSEDGERFCDALCAEAYFDNLNEETDQRNISRFYGGD